MIDTSPIIVKKILKLALTPNGRSLNITRNGNPINQQIEAMDRTEFLKSIQKIGLSSTTTKRLPIKKKKDITPTLITYDELYYKRLNHA